MRVGISVVCSVCERGKKPHGRSRALATYGVYCDEECKGYELEPLPGCLWPNESAEDFGFHSCEHATKDVAWVSPVGLED